MDTYNVIQSNDLSAMPMGSMNSYSVNSDVSTVGQTRSLKRSRWQANLHDTPEWQQYKRFKEAEQAIIDNEKNLWVWKIFTKNRSDRRTEGTQCPTEWLDLEQDAHVNAKLYNLWRQERQDLRRLHYVSKAVVKRRPL